MVVRLLARVFGPAILLALAACAPRSAGELASASHREDPRPTWAFQDSDLPVDPAYRFGQLPNGMRYIIRHNATPKGTAVVRMNIAAGSLDEREDERGYAHFVEHMAFNGSTNVPPGEMVRLLERSGLAFGADTNATTSFERTTYMLDLPRADPKLLDTALMLMRETASELTFDPAVTERERGVILAEKRDRNTWQLRNTQDQYAFLAPRARFPRRFPIGTDETLARADAARLKAFWQREYVPRHTTVVVIGDFEPAAVESAIVARFGSWQPAAAEPQPSAGPIEAGDKGRTGIHIDPALSERVTASRNAAWRRERDTVAQRSEDVLRQVGYGIVNRRLLRIARQPNPPFRGAGLGTAIMFKSGKTTNLVVDSIDRRWREGLIAAAREYRRAMTHGFTRAEVDEQVAIIRTAAEDLAASSSTRSHGALLQAVFALIHDDKVPTTPDSGLQRLAALIPQITPGAVLSALSRDAVPLTQPLLRFQGRYAPSGGAPALRAAWDEAMTGPVEAPQDSGHTAFAYTDFGVPGTVVSDTREPLLGIRQVRFANGVRLNLKQTDLERGRIVVQLSIDGGEMLDTQDNPLATEMVSVLPVGGLGKHTQDELQSLLAGRTVSTNIASTPETFVSTAATTPRDLELQLQVMTALISDPAYRQVGEVQYRLGINNFFLQHRATPGSALANAMGGILSDNDPRFTLQPQPAYRALTFAKLKGDIADRLARGAIEVGIVGDIAEETAIRLAARTLGALPARETEFRPYTEQRHRPFTANTDRRVVRHTGAADQAIVRFVWKTRDDTDPQEKQVLNLLDRILQIAVTDKLRAKLGKAYSPDASSQPSPVWQDYGTFSITGSVDVRDIAAARQAILETVRDVRQAAVSPDLLQRAREPLSESFDNALKTNRGWLTLVDRAQTEPERIERHVNARTRLAAVTSEQVQAAARRYLAEETAVEVNALPEGVDPPA